MKNQTNPITTITRNLGSNRGKTRLWLEGACLSSQGWHVGDLFTPLFQNGVITYIKGDAGGQSPEKSRRVAGTSSRPIIDTNTDRITDSLEAGKGQQANVEVSAKRIIITRFNGTNPNYSA